MIKTWNIFYFKQDTNKNEIVVMKNRKIFSHINTYLLEGTSVLLRLLSEGLIYKEVHCNWKDSVELLSLLEFIVCVLHTKNAPYLYICTQDDSKR